MIHTSKNFYTTFTTSPPVEPCRSLFIAFCLTNLRISEPVPQTLFVLRRGLRLARASLSSKRVFAFSRHWAFI